MLSDTPSFAKSTFVRAGSVFRYIRFSRTHVAALVTLVGVTIGITPIVWPLEGSDLGKLPRISADHRSVDCGASALYVVCKLNNNPQHFDHLRDLTKTSVLGTDMLSLKEAALAVGFRVLGCNCTFGTLQKHVSRPGNYAILHCHNSHFIPVIAVHTKATVRLVDPTIGIRDASASDLAESLKWVGNALLLSTHSNPDGDSR